MNWKQSLDKYLTTPPDDGFDGWVDKVIDAMSDTFFDLHDEWVLEHSGVCNDWLNKLFYKKNKLPDEAAAIIERAHSLFVK